MTSLVPATLWGQDMIFPGSSVPSYLGLPDPSHLEPPACAPCGSAKNGPQREMTRPLNATHAWDSGTSPPHRLPRSPRSP